MKTAGIVVATLLLIALAGFLRVHNAASTFLEGRIFFVDADCYSRMTRVRMVAEGEGPWIRVHRFENWPAGVQPHTTAPLDWIIVALKGALDATAGMWDPGGSSLLRAQTLDLAGALVSPLLGMMGCAFLSWWAWRAQPGLRSYSLTVPALFAISPVVVHGTLLGRPDHQSLLLLLLAIAIGLEWRHVPSLKRVPIAAIGRGLAWGFSLWVSLYEPLVLLLGIMAAALIVERRGFFSRERGVWLATIAMVAGLAWTVEGWRIPAPPEELRADLARWLGTIGELGSLDLRGPTLYRWVGWMFIVSPVLLWLAAQKNRQVVAPALLVLLIAGLSVWQLRWGYFLALTWSMTLPWQLAVCRRAWIAWPVLAISLLPLAQEWEEKYFPSDEAQRSRALRQRELVLLRDIGERMQGVPKPFLAPWWLSPPLAYWSRQPGVAGSSHQSLPGIVASARFYLAEDPAGAGAILKSRGVALVVGDDTARVIANSSAILGVSAPARPMILGMMESAPTAAPFLVPVHANQFYRLFEVESGALP